MSDIKNQWEVELLLEVVNLLREHDVRFWLDQGSLLGVVREGRFFSWDHDVDIGIWEDDREKMEKVAMRIQKMGQTVRFLPYVVKLGGKVDCRVYRRNGDFAETELRSTSKELKPSNLAKSVKKILGSLAYARDRLAGFLLGSGEITRRVSNSISWREGMVLSLNRNTRWIERARDALRDRRVIFRVDARYFEVLHAVEVYGESLPIPTEVESYLQLKYGGDWRTPRKNWKYWQDDGALAEIRFRTSRMMWGKPRELQNPTKKNRKSEDNNDGKSYEP